MEASPGDFVHKAWYTMDGTPIQHRTHTHTCTLGMTVKFIYMSLDCRRKPVLSVFWLLPSRGCHSGSSDPHTTQPMLLWYEHWVGIKPRAYAWQERNLSLSYQCPEYPEEPTKREESMQALHSQTIYCR